MVSNQRFSIKLDHYGILGDILQWIQSCITNISQQVLVEGHTSTPAPVTSGVPQGTALGALLFYIYINSLPLKNSSTTHLFADDSLLYRRIKSPEDAQKLQEDIIKTNKNLINFFNYPNDTIYNVLLFGQNPSIGSRDRSAVK